MQKTLIALGALVGSISSSSMFRAPVTEALAPYSRNFTIEASDKGTYLANMDYRLNETKAHPYLISLYTSQQIIPKDDKCNVGFAKTTDCTGDLDGICTIVKDGQATPLNVPYFTATGTPISTNLVGEYLSWKLQPESPAYNTIACDDATGKVNKNYVAGAEGIWGLGFDGKAKDNFVNKTQNFHISFTEKSKLNVVFTDSLIATPSIIGIKKRFSLKTDGNWRAATKEVSFLKYKSADALATTQILFDINYKTNGFPKAIYDEIIKALNADDIKAGCDAAAIESAACTGKVKVDQLKIEINIDGKEKFTLTAYDLVADFVAGKTEVENFKLNLRSLSSANTGAGYITADAEKLNLIIIGQKTLSPYYTAFSVSDSTVSQYEIDLQAIADFLGGILKWIIIAIVGSIIVCCLCICFCCGGTAWIVAKLGKKDKQDNYYQSSQTDPFVARK